MKFEDNETLTDFRANLALKAITLVEGMLHLRRQSMVLSGLLKPIDSAEHFISLVNDLAYQSISTVVPHQHIEQVLRDLEEWPISQQEIATVLARPLAHSLPLAAKSCCRDST
ncbi:hypothetical protein [Pseudomonas oryzihabitans]|uniref:hypothetical protein n=1 Tax=Pseudomonas oryzihabitans TaxID=47885 RepID=UPI002854F375|nr:hypothetical protein [Pseudomonas psychrotolerans]MDR6680240.1 hypothetical protein [Pseudomonas psychrotolerans]